MDNDNEIIDLGFDVTEADVARPILKDGTYDFTITSVKSGESSQAKIPQISVGFKLAQDAESDDGKPVRAGQVVLFRNYLRQPTGKLTQEMIQNQFQQIHFAAAGAGRVNTEAWLNKPVRCRVSIRESRTDKQTGKTYAARNEIERVLPPAATATGGGQ